jgi:hypothetical protein
MSIAYTSEKLTAAVSSLAASVAPLQQRLLHAAIACHTLSGANHGVDDFPSPELHERFHEWWAALNRREAVGDEGTLKATTEALSDAEAVRLAEELLSIHAHVEEAYVLAHAER